MDFVMHAPKFENGRALVDYEGGVMDTLDGSHGVHFTYLPIVYEDDCQVCAGKKKLVPDTKEWYELTITFMSETPDFSFADFPKVDPNPDQQS